MGVPRTPRTSRLEKQGWAAPQPNPSDRRSSLPALTDDGSRLIDAEIAGRSRWDAGQPCRSGPACDSVIRMTTRRSRTIAAR